MGKPTHEQIEDQRAAAMDDPGAFPGAFPGMTYTDGVTAALSWVQGDTDDAPMED